MDKISESAFAVLLARQFNSFEEFSFMARSWDVDFRQLDASPLQPFLLQAQVEGLLISRAWFGCHVDQRGTTPRHMRTFALLDEGCPQMRWFGHQVGPDVLLAFPAHCEIEVFSQPGFCVSTFSVPNVWLAEFFEQCGGPALDEALGPEETVIAVPPRLLGRLRSQLRKVSLTPHGPQALLGLADGYRERLCSILLDVFRSHTERWLRTAQLPNQRLIERVVALVDARGDNPLTLADLCNAGQVAERTLINTFKREFGITPKAYVKGHRLFRVHRELWHADLSATRVSDVANVWGFWHMGQFAADYKKLFGELPSDTLKRSGMARHI